MSLFIILFIFSGIPLFVSASDNNSTCVENWKCTSWGSCYRGERECWDINNCGTERDKPREEKNCYDDYDRYYFDKFSSYLDHYNIYSYNHSCLKKLIK